MRRVDRWVRTSLCFLALTVFPASGNGEDAAPSDVYDCGKRICEEWAPKGENTCRTCTTAQCRRKQDGAELLVGRKKESECYEGHAPPPKDPQG